MYPLISILSGFYLVMIDCVCNYCQNFQVCTFVLSRNVLFLIYNHAQLKAIVCVDMLIFNQHACFLNTKSIILVI